MKIIRTTSGPVVAGLVGPPLASRLQMGFMLLSKSCTDLFSFISSVESTGRSKSKDVEIRRRRSSGDHGAFPFHNFVGGARAPWIDFRSLLAGIGERDQFVAIHNDVCLAGICH